jgi:hypothetical protein
MDPALIELGLPWAVIGALLTAVKVLYDRVNTVTDAASARERDMMESRIKDYKDQVAQIGDVVSTLDRALDAIKGGRSDA